MFESAAEGAAAPQPHTNLPPSALDCITAVFHQGGSSETHALLLSRSRTRPCAQSGVPLSVTQQKFLICRSSLFKEI